MTANKEVALSDYDARKVDYTIMIIGKYALARGISRRDAFFELLGCGGIDALDEFYDVEHTLPVSTTVDDLRALHERGAA